MTTVKQLFDILQKQNRLNLLSIDSNIVLDSGFVKLIPKCEISEDDEIAFNYCFYHHLDPEFPRSKIIRAIEDKDFATFCGIYNEWSFVNDLVYLPDLIYIYNVTKDDCVGAVSGIWLKEIFNLIDSADYECG